MAWEHAAAWMACLGLVAGPACAQTPAGAPADLGARFQKALEDLDREFDFPGATAAYVLPDGRVGRAAVGLADVEARAPMTPETRMLAASIGKSFVGAEAVALAVEGRLDLDAPISTWLADQPWFKRLANADAITLRQLLQHTSGIPDHVYMKAFEDFTKAHWRDEGPMLTPEGSIAFVLDQPPLFEPGEGWNYSDTGYLLTGLIIEQVTGTGFYDEVRRRFLEPLGLTLTSPSDRRELPGLAAGYMKEGTSLGLPAKTTTAPGVLAFNPGFEWTGGGFVSNSGDLARWAKALFEGRAIEGTYLDQLFTAAPTGPDEGAARYGAGVGIRKSAEFGTNYGHGGWFPGYVSSMRYYVDHGVAIAFQINTDIGLHDDSTKLYDEMEQRLARVVIEAAKNAAAAPMVGFLGERAARQRALEARFDRQMSAASIGQVQRRMSSAPNHVGSVHNRENAEFVLKQFQAWGWDAKIESFDVLYPTPKRMLLELQGPERFQASFMEPPIEGDATTRNTDGVLPAYLIFAADGDVTAPLVYVNFGLAGDYATLKKLGVDVRGKIVIARYGGGWRGSKVKLAHEHGAAGAILYSDPAQDGFGVGAVYPQGAWRPDTGIQRGAVIDLPVAPGDPLTPGVAATPDARRLPISKASTIMKIPAVPISYGDAQHFLAALEGPEAPTDWRGALPVPYRVGPSASTVRLAVESDWSLKTIQNVIARIEGVGEPGQWILRGNNRDAWVYGAWVPLSGHSAMLEEAKAIGALVREGWRPRRTIVYASWDAEEAGLVGSTEWVEQHANELSARAALYVNTGVNGRGFLDVNASYSTQQLVDEIAADVLDPQDAVSLRARKRAATKTENMPVGDLGAGSDFTPFAQHLGVASIDLGFSGEDEQYGVYHSAYDTIEHFERFGDPGFVYGLALAQVTGRAVLRAAQADVLPFSFRDLGSRMGAQIAELAQASQDRLDLTPLTLAVNRLGAQAQAYEARLSAAGEIPAATLREMNRDLARFERCLVRVEGLPGRPWYRHLGYAPSLTTGYEAKTLPGVREPLEQGNWSEARKYTGWTATAINGCANRIERVTALLSNG